MSIGDDLDWVQSRLQDNEALWTREELLRYYNDGYRRIMSESAAVTRFTVLDVPGRFSYTYCYDWEAKEVSGTMLQVMFPCKSGAYVSTYLWEAQELDGVTTVNSQPGLTQLWEMSEIGSVDHHFQFGLPKSHDHIKRIAYDDELLLPVAVKELDWSDQIWFRAPGEPRWWTSGVGRNRDFEIYEIVTAYSQGYAQMDSDNGIPRQFTGDRTYSASPDSSVPNNAYAYTTSGDVDGLTADLGGFGVRITIQANDAQKTFCTQQWEADQLNGNTLSTGAIVGCFNFESIYGASVGPYAVGCIRSIISPDREYLPMMSGAAPDLMYGSIREFKSSALSVSVIETVIPDLPLTEDDLPGLIPAQMQKYLRYYVLATAYAKQGEGQRKDLAEHYEMRFQRGIGVLARIGWITRMDRVYVREEITETVVRPPRVRLPVHYPVVLY